MRQSLRHRDKPGLMTGVTALIQCLRPSSSSSNTPEPRFFVEDRGGGVRVAKPSHLDWLFDTGERRTSACGREVEIWALDPKDDAAILSAWAWHFRQHYITDADLPAMVNGTGLSKADYLRTILLPDAKVTPGPSLRSGDFGEILIGDYIEFVLGYWCPRELRYQDRWNRNDSTKGCDVIGFKFVADGAEDPGDELFIFESKSGMTRPRHIACRTRSTTASRISSGRA
jgi:hypothetical protein